MFVLTEAQAAEIRTVYEQHGEFSAVVELRRLFPGLGDIAWARECIRSIAGWQPLLTHGPQSGRYWRSAGRFANRGEPETNRPPLRRALAILRAWYQQLEQALNGWPDYLLSMVATGIVAIVVGIIGPRWLKLMMLTWMWFP